MKLLSASTINAVRNGGELPPPDFEFRAMIANRYRKVGQHLRYRDVDDMMQDALVAYWQACLAYDPERNYRRGPTGFVGGRVLARLSNSVRTDLRRRQWTGEFPLDEKGQPIEIEDESTSLDVSVLLSEIRDLAIKALDASEEYVMALFDNASGGDREAVGTLMKIVSEPTFEEAPMSTGLKYVRPHDGDAITRMDSEAVARGFADLGGAGELPASDNGTPSADAIAVLDSLVDSRIASSGVAFECVIENDGKGCGSIIPELDYCPYCGETFDEDSDGGVAAVEERETPEPTPEPTRVSKKRGRPSLGASVESFFRTWAEDHSCSITERKAYIAIISPTGKKIALTKFKTAFSMLIICRSEFDALDESVRGDLDWLDAAERKRRHYGRDTVIFRGDDLERLDELLGASLRSSGKSLDE